MTTADCYRNLIAAIVVDPRRVARLGYRLYLGTVPHAVKQRRRAANRVARRSRKVNR